MTDVYAIQILLFGWNFKVLIKGKYQEWIIFKRYTLNRFSKQIYMVHRDGPDYYFKSI